MPERPHTETMRALYDYWSERFFGWADGPHRVRLHDQNTTKAHKLIAAIFGLLRNMQPDGYLAYRGSGDDFGVQQLATFMHVGKATAVVYLEWLRREGCMTEKAMFDERGHRLASSRRLVIPSGKPQFQQSSSDLNLGERETPSSANGGPKFSKRGSQVQQSSSDLTHTQETRRPGGEVHQGSTHVS